MEKLNTVVHEGVDGGSSPVQVVHVVAIVGEGPVALRLLESVHKMHLVVRAWEDGPLHKRAGAVPARVGLLYFCGREVGCDEVQSCTGVSLYA